jgi:long-chain fatty acid transport protein
MKRFLSLWGQVFAGILICTLPMLGGGFSIYEQGTRAMGFGGAFTASANDASAIFYNPAGIGFMSGTQFYVGATAIFPMARFSGMPPYPGYGIQEETKEQVFFPPHFFITHALNEKWHIGFGIYTPYGLGVEWDNRNKFTGRYISQNAELKAFYFAPELSYHFSEKFAIAAGVQMVYSTVKLERALSQPFLSNVLDVATLKLEGNNGNSFAFDVSAMYKPIERLQLGAVYRSKVSNDYEGDAEFKQISTGDPALDLVIKSGLPTNAEGENEIGVATKITFPWQFASGIMFRASDKLSVEFNFMRFGWSTFDELPFDFESQKEPGDLNTPENSVVREDYEDSNQYRIGFEYRTTDKLTLRTGYIFDNTPQPVQSLSVLLPDADRHDITVGFGYQYGKLNIDAAAMFILTKERSTEGLNADNYNGIFHFGAQLLGLSLGYSL